MDRERGAYKCSTRAGNPGVLSCLSSGLIEGRYHSWIKYSTKKKNLPVLEFVDRFAGVEHT